MDTVEPKRHPGTPPTSPTSLEDSGLIGAGPVGPTYIMAQMIADAKLQTTTKQPPRRIPWEATPEETTYI